jgi:hypothetical protein
MGRLSGTDIGSVGVVDCGDTLEMRRDAPRDSSSMDVKSGSPLVLLDDGCVGVLLCLTKDNLPLTSLVVVDGDQSRLIDHPS